MNEAHSILLENKLIFISFMISFMISFNFHLFNSGLTRKTRVELFLEYLPILINNKHLSLQN